MHKKILGVVILAGLAATALGVVILKKDRAPAAQPASALSEKVVMVPPPASAPIPAPVPTMVPPVSPVPGMAPTGSPPPPPVPAVAGTRTVPVAPPSAGGGPGAAPLAPSGSVPAGPGTLAPPQPGMPSAALGDSLDGIETMPRELKPQRVSMFLKLTAEQQLVSAEYFMALDRVNSEEIQSFGQMMAPPPSSMMAPPTSVLPPLVARPLPARISDLESRVKRLKDVQALREKFLKVLTKEQTKKLKPYLDKDLI